VTIDSTKADDIAAELEREIVAGVLAPGTVLRQEQLSQRFDVSRTPIREALRRLSALGLVAFEPNRGVRVRTLSRDELHEAFLVRAELESLATELAASRLTSEGHAELEAASRRFAELTETLLLGKGDRRTLTAEWVRANHAFHDVIYAAAAAPMVERIAKSARRTFSGQAVWGVGASEVDDLYRRNVEQHEAIRQALAAGSPAGARALAREHVLHSFHLLERVLEQVGGPADERRRRLRRSA
jgi:DNA-binding GntR family transcriptional regulator